jgi:hypothetical protein
LRAFSKANSGCSIALRVEDRERMCLDRHPLIVTLRDGGLGRQPQRKTVRHNNGPALLVAGADVVVQQGLASRLA